MKVRSERALRTSWLVSLIWGVVWTGQAGGQQAFMPPPPAAMLGPAAGTPGGYDPVESAPREETLEAAWQTALSADQRLASGNWNLSAAESNTAVARAQRLPSLSVGADYLVLSQQPMVQASLSPTQGVEFPMMNQQSAGFHSLVTQPVYTFGRISHGIQAAESSAGAQQADVTRATLDVKITVAEIYVTVLRAGRIVGLAESKVVSLTGHNRDVTRLFENGMVSKNDQLSAQVALADAQQQLLNARNNLDVAHATYNRALGRGLAEPVRLAEVRDEIALDDVDSLTHRALPRRPELTGLSFQAQALREQAASEQAKTAPQVSVTGGYIYQQDRYIDPNGEAVLMVGATWNVFDSGRVRHEANSLSEKAEGVVRLYKDTESMIALEVRQRWLELQTARQRVEVARQTTALADENLRVARGRYQQHVGTNTEVLDAETLRVQAYTNLFDSTYQAVLAGLRLRRATGDI